jgi:hypothetical protein
MSGNGCGQPGFRMAEDTVDGGNLTDVAVTIQAWSAGA